MPNGKSGQRLGIADVIEAVHRELIESQQRRERDGLDALFTTKQLELELSFTVQRVAGGVPISPLWSASIIGCMARCS